MRVGEVGELEEMRGRDLEKVGSNEERESKPK